MRDWKDRLPWIVTGAILWLIAGIIIFVPEISGTLEDVIAAVLIMLGFGSFILGWPDTGSF